MAKPRKGARGAYQSVADKTVGFTIHSVEGNLCYAEYDNDPGYVGPFIWRFRDGLNSLHDWPGKHEADASSSAEEKPA